MIKNGKIFPPYSEELKKQLEETALEAYRIILGRPNMTVEEMREMNKTNVDTTTRVTFLKKK